MATPANDIPQRKRVLYSAEYPAEVLALAERIGVVAAASELGLYATQIYQWRAKAAHEKPEEVEILGKTAGYFAKKLD